MTGTPSRTATAYDDGPTRHSAAAGAFLHEPTAVPRGYVERKLKAKLRSEEHEAHMRRTSDGRGSKALQSPMSSGSAYVYATDIWSEGHASYPGRSVCLHGERNVNNGCGQAEEVVQAAIGSTPLLRSEECATRGIPSRAREAARSTRDRQKSADSTSCPRTAT